jgi:hypothetical protein
MIFSASKVKYSKKNMCTVVGRHAVCYLVGSFVINENIKTHAKFESGILTLHEFLEFVDDSVKHRLRAYTQVKDVYYIDMKAI